MWHFVKGYVILIVEGVYPERFLNLLRSAAIPLWGVRRREDGSLELRLYRRDVKKLPALRRKCRCRVHILKKGGLPSWLKSLKKRWVLLWGTLLFLILLGFASRRIWFVEVSGCQNMDQEVLLTTLLKEGVGRGKNIRGLVLSDIGRRVEALYDEIAFLGLEREGVCLKITVWEARGEGASLDYSIPCDVVAEKSGVITRLTVYRGEARVKVGDRVERGDILISGTVTAWDESMTYTTHAMGEIYMARVYEGEAQAPLYQSEERETGAEAPYSALLLGERILWEKKSPYARSLLYEGERVRLWNLFCPITLIRGVYGETEEVQSPLNEEERRSQAGALAQQRALLQVPRTASILMIHSYTCRREGVLMGFCTVTAEEKTGIQREIET